MRLAFVGSPPFATPILEALLASRFAPAVVVTRPDKKRGRGRSVQASPIATLARESGVRLFQPESAGDEDFLDALEAEAPDVTLVAAYGEFLGARFRGLPRLECLNVHPSLLPRHRGASPIQAAILAGDEATGVSIQRVVREVDAGDVVVALEAPMQRGETAAELSERLSHLGARASLEALEAIDAGSAVFRAQDPERVTLCKKLEKADGAIDWSADALAIERQVLALNPWPMARTRFGGERELVLLRARALDAADGASPSAGPGTLLETREAMRVATGSGVLAVDEVKPAGKRAMTGVDFLRGARLEAGERLG